MIKGLMKVIVIGLIIFGLYQLMKAFPLEVIMVVGIICVAVIIYWLSQIAN